MITTPNREEILMNLLKKILLNFFIDLNIDGILMKEFKNCAKHA